MSRDWLDIDRAFAQLEAEPDWLSIGDKPAVSAEPDYLDTATPSDGVQAVRAAAPYAQLKFQVMSGTDRVWATNGRYVAVRPSGFNPSTRQRHARFLSSGHYKHVDTSDDVQVFELQPGSPFYRTEGDVRAGSWYELLRAAAQAAVARDFGAYVDLLSEIATRLKSTQKRDVTGRLDEGWAADQFADTLAHLEQLIFMRWTYKQEMKTDEDYGLAMVRMKAEIDQGVSNIRQARGEKAGRVIALPPTRTVMRIR